MDIAVQYCHNILRVNRISRWLDALEDGEELSLMQMLRK